ncbi:MAG: hypothetical protein CM15mP120_23120 [Pseudomonadota bacterium]|nr:MAG: hypothetical protein CM15mP120_23120 [Pseudomonadota bacterium]
MGRLAWLNLPFHIPKAADTMNTYRWRPLELKAIGVPRPRLDVQRVFGAAHGAHFC